MKSSITITGNGNSSALYVPQEADITIVGTWGGGTVTPQISLDAGVTFAPLKVVDSAGVFTAVTFTGDVAFKVDLADAQIRFALSGATSPNLVVNLATKAGGV